MKKCELCKSDARIYCESDEANLCWNCDAKVHSANFLVARHSRCLLCFVCRSPTPWSGSGQKLGRTVSICERCVNGVKEGKGESVEESVVGNDDDHGEIQVVLPPAVSSSGSEETSSRFCYSDEDVSSKRTFQYRVEADLKSNFQDDHCSSSSARSKSIPVTGDQKSEFSVSVSSRPLKIRKI